MKKLFFFYYEKIYFYFFEYESNLIFKSCVFFSKNPLLPKIETTIKIIKRLKLKIYILIKTKIYSQNTENGLPSICIELHLIPDDFLISYLSTQDKMHFYNMYFFSAIEQLIIPNSAFKDSLFYISSKSALKKEKHNI